jgi:hypothetical protein
VRMPHAYLICICLLGAAQLGSSQTQTAPIPGYYNPTTRQFATRLDPTAALHPDAQAAITGSSVFFREQFNITITNYDQNPGDSAVCAVSIDSFGDTNSAGYHDTATTPATLSGNNWTCSVPILTLWTLQTPGTDSISVEVDVYIYPPNQTAVAGELPSLRESSQSMTLSQPANGQTVTNNVTFQL